MNIKLWNVYHCCFSLTHITTTCLCLLVIHHQKRVLQWVLLQWVLLMMVLQLVLQCDLLCCQLQSKNIHAMQCMPHQGVCMITLHSGKCVLMSGNQKPKTNFLQFQRHCLCICTSILVKMCTSALYIVKQNTRFDVIRPTNQIIQCMIWWKFASTLFNFPVVWLLLLFVTMSLTIHIA